MSLRSRMRYMNPYDIHKAIINEYVLKRPGDTKYLKRDSSNDKTDYDILRENHKFLWDDDEESDTWEVRFAKKYYSKLFKEYCIGDLSRYKENKIALRWRIEKEVFTGKGQFICANKICLICEDLKTWEVNFAYLEHGEKKNALVKIRLCPPCSEKLNYHTKKREIKRLKHDRHRKDKYKLKGDHSEVEVSLEDASCSKDLIDNNDTTVMVEETGQSPWDNLKPIEIKTRDEEMEEYLQELLL